MISSEVAGRAVRSPLDKLLAVVREGVQKVNELVPFVLLLGHILQTVMNYSRQAQAVELLRTHPVLTNII